MTPSMMRAWSLGKSACVVSNRYVHFLVFVGSGFHSVSGVQLQDVGEREAQANQQLLARSLLGVDSVDSLDPAYPPIATALDDGCVGAVTPSPSPQLAACVGFLRAIARYRNLNPNTDGLLELRSEPIANVSVIKLPLIDGLTQSLHYHLPRASFNFAISDHLGQAQVLSSGQLSQVVV